MTYDSTDTIPAPRKRRTVTGMLLSFERILAHVSQEETVFAVEFIGSGTIGNGCGLEVVRQAD